MFDSISTSKLLPKARTSDIVVQNIENEVLVYDLRNNKAHQLNRAMSLIWKNCDGSTTNAAVIEKLERETSSKIDTDFIEFGLNELQKIRLLPDKTRHDSMQKISRRDIAFKYAPIAMALPIVVSLVAPPAVQAQSCLPPSMGVGDPNCAVPADCCDMNCVDFGGIFFCQPAP